MSEPEPPPVNRPPTDGPAGRLESWKDIATYLKRDVSTVQRWEKREGMPVHRHLHDKLGSVFAYRWEIDAWSQSRSLTREDGAGTPPQVALESPTDASRSLPPGSTLEAGAPTRSRRASRWRIAWWTIGTAAVLAAGFAFWLLDRAEYFWRNPLADAQFRLMTDLEGAEQAAAMSRDGRFIAFLSDRDGPVDVWVIQVGTGQFHNLTRGSIRELTNASVRTISFSPDASLVSFWVRERDASNVGRIGIWTVPTLGGPPRPYLKDVAELDWSSDGARLTYHTPGPGDPLFIRDRAHSADRQIFEAPVGLHGHFPVWSPDDTFIYFVLGVVPDEMDIWRIRAAGGAPERITAHHSHVSHPVFLNRRTLLYLATSSDARAGLYAVDVERRIPHRVSAGPGHYTSLAGSADGRRLVATVASSKGTLWRVPISEQVVEESAAARIALPTGSGFSPRSGANYLLYVSSRGGRTGIWKLADGGVTEMWSGPDGRIVGMPAIARNKRGIAFVVEERGRRQLYVMDDSGTNVRALPEPLDVRGSPAWSPDGASITVATNHQGTPRLVTVSLDGGSSVPLVSEYSTDPAWSPDGRFLAYSGPDVGTTFQVKAAALDGGPYPLPNLTLPRGGRHLAFLPGRRALVVLRGEIERKNFWLIDLETGAERRLTNFGRDFIIKDFDVSEDGREIVFDRLQESSDVVLIERP